MSETANYIQVLLTTLKRQEETLQELLQITQEQSHIAERADFEETMLDDSLNRKEILITKLNEYDDGFTSVYGRIRDEVKNDPNVYQEELGEIRRLIKRCTDLGVEIRVLEERNRDKLTQCFANRQKVYAAKRNAASVASHYNQTMNNQRVMDAYRFNQKN